MIDTGLAIHRSLWSGPFTLAIVLIVVFRLWERHYRLGRSSRWGFARSVLYVAVLATAAPFFVSLLNSIPGYRQPPIGPLPTDVRLFGAIVVFMVFWLEPDIARIRPGRFVLKLVALWATLHVLGNVATIPGSDRLTDSAARVRPVSVLLVVWAILTVAVHAVYRYPLDRVRTWQAAGGILLVVTALAAATLPGAYALATVLLTLAFSPWLLAVATRVPSELTGIGIRNLYALGVMFVRQPGGTDLEETADADW